MLSMCQHPQGKIVDKMTSFGREDDRIGEFRSFGRSLRLSTQDVDARNCLFVDCARLQTAARSC